MSIAEARIAIARATSVFIMYLSSNAAATAHKHNHKTFSAQDVFDSINEMDFKTFTGPMKTALISYQKTIKDKKNSKKNSLDIRKSISLSATSTISPTTKVVNHKMMQNTASPPQPPLAMSADIIEIDDSD